MRDLFFKLFSDTPFGVSEGWHIQSFNIWHFVYIILIFGGIIGVAGSIYDLVTRNYVLNNRAAFEAIAAENARKDEEEAAANGKVRLTVEYACAGGAATAIACTLDGLAEKHLVSSAAPASIYVAPGVHVLTVKYNFKDYRFQVVMEGNKTVSLYGSISDVKLNGIR